MGILLDELNKLKKAVKNIPVPSISKTSSTPIPFYPTPDGRAPVIIPKQKANHYITSPSPTHAPIPVPDIVPEGMKERGRAIVEAVKTKSLAPLKASFKDQFSKFNPSADITTATNKNLPKEEREAAFNRFSSPVIGAVGPLKKVFTGNVPEWFLQQLAKEKSPQVIESTLKNIGLDVANSSALAPKLSTANTIDDVKNVLMNHGTQTEQELARQNFNKTWQDAYGNRPATIDQPTQLGLRNKVNYTGTETPAEILAKAEADAAKKHLKFDFQGNPVPYTAREKAIVNQSLPSVVPKPSLPPLTNKVKTPKPTKTLEIPVPRTTVGLIKRDLAPLKYVDEDTANVFRTWNGGVIKAKELANQTAQDVKIPNDSMDLIHRYQAGENIPEVKQVFDNLYNEANARGLDVPYRQNYVPQVWKGTYNDTQKALVKYMKDNGINTEQAQQYINGASELPSEIANRLKLSPSFDKERIFPDYKTGMKYGLIPKYKTVSELAANYRGELEKVLVNQNLLETLKKSGQIKPADSEFTPKNWVVLNKEFSNKLYSAPPNVAKVINNIFPNPDIKGAMSSILKNIGEASSMSQNVILSAGLPRTNINFFAIGQLNKELHTGNAKAVKAYIASNSKSATVKYFNKHQQTLFDMAEQGIDITSRIGAFGKDTFGGLLKEKEFTKALGFGIDKIFGEKTFQGFLPMMNVQLFEDVYKGAIKKGMTVDEAKVLAGNIVKKNFGMNTDDFARSEKVRDGLKAVFFAPRFRESIINSLTNTGKAGLNLVSHLGGLRGKIDPNLSRNRRLLAGMILSFGIYNYINKELNGNYMWDNPDNRKFALRIPQENGEIMYVEFMPSYLAFARNMVAGVLNTGKGDIKQATQQFGSVFSIPIKMTTELIGNSDYFGNPIYKDTDSGAEKAKKIGKYLGLNYNHPYIKEIVNQIEDKKPFYQSVITGLELPLKFSTNDKEEANKIFDLMDVQNQERADTTKIAQKEYENLKSIPPEERNAFMKNIYDSNPDVYNKMVDIVEANQMGLSKNEKYIKMLGIKYRAKYILEQMQKIPPEERNAYARNLEEKKILTKDTYAELAQLINKPNE